MRDNNKFNYIDSYDFRTLRNLITTGEPINREAWIWYFNKVGKGRCPPINLSGGTEIGGAILSTTYRDGNDKESESHITSSYWIN